MVKSAATLIRVSKRHRGASATLGRVERKKREKLARIKRAARALFARKGFELTTTREIAEAADVGAGTVFLHAGSKQDLLVMIFREEAGHAVDAAFENMTERRLIDQLLRVFGALIAHHERDLELARVFVKELPFVDDQQHGRATFMADLFRRMAALIDRAQARGELRAGVPSHRLAKNLFALFFACLHEWLGAGVVTPKERDAALRASLELHLVGLRPSGEK
ncbi:MAG: TetR/AcrR family transcriptional regulator [Candidatus Binataceae bacterium]